jgi:hypothetical protein
MKTKKKKETSKLGNVIELHIALIEKAKKAGTKPKSSKK